MTREEAITVLKAFMKNPLFSEVHKAAFNIAIHDIKAYQDWNINNLILVNKDNYEPTTKNNLGVDWESYKDADGNSLDYLILNVLQNSFDCGDAYGYTIADKIIGLLPSVTPQEPKTGHWVHGEYCSECGCDVPAYIVDWKWQKDMDAKYCPNCGARMVDPQESEDKA